MAHNITQAKNGQYMTAWAGDTPWHRLGQQADGLMTATEALIAANLDWLVEKRPLYNQTENGPEVVPDTYGVFRKEEEDGTTNWIPLNRGTAVGRVYSGTCLIEIFSLEDKEINLSIISR